MRGARTPHRNPAQPNSSAQIDLSTARADLQAGNVFVQRSWGLACGGGRHATAHIIPDPEHNGWGESIALTMRAANRSVRHGPASTAALPPPCRCRAALRVADWVVRRFATRCANEDHSISPGCLKATLVADGNELTAAGRTHECVSQSSSKPTSPAVTRMGIGSRSAVSGAHRRGRRCMRVRFETPLFTRDKRFNKQAEQLKI